MMWSRICEICSRLIWAEKFEDRRGPRGVDVTLSVTANKSVCYDCLVEMVLTMAVDLREIQKQVEGERRLAA